MKKLGYFCFHSRPLKDQFLRQSATASSATNLSSGEMRAWAIPAFGAPLQQIEKPIPQVQRDDHVLIRVRAASVNPIDVRMSEGYGRQLIGLLSHFDSSALSRPFSSDFPSPSGLVSALADRKHRQFPLVLGRDCSGEVFQLGSKAAQQFEVGDQVIAVVPPTMPGSHADYVLVPSSCVSAKPASLSHSNAASLPYAASTAWAALVTTARLRPNNTLGTRVLIHGGAGGVGTIAIQMLRDWGSEHVVATCSQPKMQFVEELGAKAVDYQSNTAKEEIIALGPYEIILDCVDSELAAWSDSMLGTWRNCVHVSIVNSLLHDTDRYGVAMGVASTGAKLLCRNVAGPFLKGAVYLPAFFAPSVECLDWVAEASERGTLRPMIEQVLPFSAMPEAYEKVGRLSGKGKTVIDFDA